MTTPPQPASPRSAPPLHASQWHTTPIHFWSPANRRWYGFLPSLQPCRTATNQLSFAVTIMPRPNAQIWAFLHRRSCSTDLWIGQLFLEHSTFLPTSHHRPHVRRQIQQTAIWNAQFVCVNHLPEPSLSSELNFHVSESVCECWCLCLRVFVLVGARMTRFAYEKMYRAVTVTYKITRKLLFSYSLREEDNYICESAKDTT